MLPAVDPNAVATRPTLSAKLPGDIRLTINAAVRSAKKAYSRSTTFSPIAVAIPTSRVKTGNIRINENELGHRFHLICRAYPLPIKAIWVAITVMN